MHAAPQMTFSRRRVLPASIPKLHRWIAKSPIASMCMSAKVEVHLSHTTAYMTHF
jgi:hypothetical protein